MHRTTQHYHNNKDEYAKRRRDRYANDPEYRKKVLDQAADYREKRRKKRAKAGKQIQLNGKMVSAITSTEICDELGAERTRLKHMQKAGYIPPALVSRPVRLYTKKQFALIRKMHEFLETNGAYLRNPNSPSGDKVMAELEALKSTIAKQWET